MNAIPLVRLGKLMRSETSSLDPRRFPEEKFELFSIPSFDAYIPDRIEGKYIGSAKQSVEPGDVLLSRIVPHIRRSWVVPQQEGLRQIASGEWIVFRHPDIYPGYMRHLLTSDDFHAQFMMTVAGVGGSLLRARPSHVANISVPMPRRSEQRRIAAILDQADALRAKRRAALAQLDEMAQAIFVEMFGSNQDWPVHWEMRSFNTTMVDETARSERVQKNDFQLTGRFPVIDQGQTEVAGYSDNEAAICRSSLPCILFGDHTRKIKLIHRPFVVGADGAKVLVPHKGMNAVFLAHMLRSSDIPDLGYSRHMRELKRMHFPAPPPTLQKQFADRMRHIDELKQAQEISAETLNILFASLQHRAFAGEL